MNDTKRYTRSMTLDSEVSVVKGVGTALGEKLHQVGIKTVAELIDYYPRRYDDYSLIEPISAIVPGIVTLQVNVKQIVGRYVRRGLHITEAVASDDSGSVRLVWFNQPYRAAAIKHDTDYYISGTFGLNNRRLSIVNPSMELVSDFPVSTARILPIYREVKGLKSLQIRRCLRAVAPMIESLPETLPAWIITEQKLMSRAEALMTIHFPENAEHLAWARRRLGFEEVFQLSLASLINKYELMQHEAPLIPFNEKLAREFVSHLPFTLTDAQRKVIWRVYQDIGKTSPMNRLVEGDVGSGKTVVAAMAALMAMEQGHQVALMAPTELLARQHAETIYKLMQPLGYEAQVGLLVGGLKPAQKLEAQKRIASGEIRFMVGTQALIQEKVDMKSLGLVIVDEQHRFGVEQRKKLQAKAGHALHVLSMTATPIPRSLALTLYGEMDISIIDSKPGGRKPIMTKITSPNSRPALYKKIETELAAGRQMFVVTPLIADSEVLVAASAEKVYKDMKLAFPKYRVGLMHGKLKPEDKNQVMEDFVAHKLDIMVSTTVIEVGVDVPNATVMLIENAERFGLAQIHQLRGRVGRSSHQGYAYLMMGDSTKPSRRLLALESSSDGFALAELDLEIRGPGAIYGSMQHGELDLRIAKLSDTRLIAAARNSAQEFIDKGDDLLQYPYLYTQVSRLRAVTNLN
jgi:ATP-dependent DNA helicase RecG